jgi:hypothetical protein
MESQLLTAAECDWAGCLWLLPRLQRNLVAAALDLGLDPSWGAFFLNCFMFEKREPTRIWSWCPCIDFSGSDIYGT